jgi:tripartite-type tricarboxylate transporter receptor subunit TctC
LNIGLTHAVNPWLYKLPYDPIRAFSPVAGLAFSPNVLVVNRDLPVKTVKELVDLAKQRPGQLQYASGGIGSFTHLGGELFKLAAGVNLLHVPFRGGGPAMIDVIGGHTKLAFIPIVAAAPHIRSGKLKALGTGGSKRSALLSDIPTIAEAGVPSYEAVNWWGIVAPAGTSTAIVETLQRAITEVQNLAQVQKQFATEGAEVLQMSSNEFGYFIGNEINKWERVVKENGIKPE